MITLRTVFQRMARLVGELARASGKRIEFSLSGEDTELDRRIVEEIGDPLVHMLRNACDHGIESPQERIEAGKSPVGRIGIEASHQGGAICIAIRDDGRGLDRGRILARARRCGLLGSDRTDDEVSDSEAFALVFRPGFSTAERVTELSGRGVGMDVVKRDIEALRGSIEIESAAGAGSRFTIRLPLTLAIIDGTLVRIGHERFVVPTESVVAPILLAPGDALRLPSGAELARCRGEWLSLRRLQPFDEPDESQRGVRDRSLVLVLESHGCRYAFAVDEVLGRQQAVIKSVGSGPWVDPIVAGATILGDGRVALILDIAALAPTRARNEPAEAPPAAGGTA
jgi:two-component system chemotaxis sensor kinase CheA